MDIRKVKKLIELLEASDINELEITEGEESVRISRGAPAQAYAAPVPVAPAMPAAAPAPAAATAAPAAASPDELAGHIVRSPMVGTFLCLASTWRRRICYRVDLQLRSAMHCALSKQ